MYFSKLLFISSWVLPNFQNVFEQQSKAFLSCLGSIFLLPACAIILEKSSEALSIKSLRLIVHVAMLRSSENIYNHGKM